jgi:sec-independent protein translocase protein TatA
MAILGASPRAACRQLLKRGRKGRRLDVMGLDNPVHIVFILIILLLVFGAKRLPEMGRSLGDGMRGFKDALSGEGAQPARAAVTEAVSQPLAEPAREELAA